MESREHQYLMNAVQLADNITHTSGSTFFHVDWYKQAKVLIEEYRNKKFTFDAAEIMKKKDDMLKIIQPKLDGIIGSFTNIKGKGYR